MGRQDEVRDGTVDMDIGATTAGSGTPMSALPPIYTLEYAEQLFAAPTPAPASVPAPSFEAPPLITSAPAQAREGMLLIGDSLSVGAYEEGGLSSAMVGMPLAVDATRGIPLAEGMRRYRRHKREEGLPRVVGMPLFTNDDPANVGALRRAVGSTVADARRRGGTVLWATIHRGGRYDEANRFLRTAARRNPDAMRLVDWERMVQRHPQWMGPDDGVHPKPAGYRARARAFANAARS